MMSILILQLIFTVFVFVIMLFCYFFPIIMAKCRYRKRLKRRNAEPVSVESEADVALLRPTAQSLCNSTSAGIFLGMCFLGLVPYTREKFESIFQNMNVHVNFPVSECVIMLGYFMTLSLEQTVAVCRTDHSATTTSHDDEEADNLLECTSNFGNAYTGSGTEDGELAGSESATTIEMCSYNPTHSQHRPTTDHIGNHCHSHIGTFASKESGLHFLLLLVAISLHSVFEGMALGLQTDSPKAVSLFISIVLHECLIALALGSNPTSIKQPTKTSIKFGLFFASSIPLGILLGVLIGTTPGLVGEALSAVLQGISAGTFLHVTFQELLPAEFSVPKDNMLKLLFLFLGFVIVVGVTILTGHH